ncbi:hypothetical protein LUZ63_013999 [Rhynchospora breviuscula]|uniref:Pentatricopeptide repeat-containing protein n=1 Tax=Rhynchospora breviuscula TaxID=2022672 RepID=A0A9Q0C9K9_9POAL|nr:hypothetical protein LUZ63_013999 [Rhynchospora breviuscula]
MLLRRLASIRPPTTKSLPIPLPPQPLNPPPPPQPQPQPQPSSDPHHSTILHLLHTTPPSHLSSSLSNSHILPTPSLISSLLPSLSSLPPSSLLSFSLWARPVLSASLLTSFVDLLSRHHSFHSAWTLLLSSPSPLVSFAPLFRRYARANLPSSAVRTLRFIHSHPESISALELTESIELDPIHLFVDALCKEGHARYAAEFVSVKKRTDNWVPSVQIYNSLLHGWFRLRQRKKAERLWDEMCSSGVEPTVVTYGILIEGLCRMRRPELALQFMEEMSSRGIEPNHYTCNPIVDSLAEAGRFEDALAMLEKMPMYGVSPNVSTFNSLVKGFCKNRNLDGASDILKQMIRRDILPTTTTYNYFFLFFAKYGKDEEGMNLYAKMVDSGYKPDRLTYHQLIKMLCEKDRVQLAVQMINEMNKNGFESDLATSTMHVHLLCRSRRFEEACKVFEKMFQRGIVPQYITYKMLVKELQRLGLKELEEKLTSFMNSVPHSTKLPESYRDDKEGYFDKARRKSIMKKARIMSDVLKDSCTSEIKSQRESHVETANRLVAEINRRVMQLHAFLSRGITTSRSSKEEALRRRLAENQFKKNPRNKKYLRNPPLQYFLPPAPENLKSFLTDRDFNSGEASRFVLTREDLQRILPLASDIL